MNRRRGPSYTVPVGIAVQDGNYIGMTNSTKVETRRRNLVPLLHGFARDFLRVDYLFWVDQSPYFEEDLLPCLTDTAPRAAGPGSTPKALEPTTTAIEAGGD